MIELTQDRLKYLLHYEPCSGIITWVNPLSRRIKAGSVAGCVHKVKGYQYIGIHGKIHLLHRIAWLYMTGSFPDNDIDHINHMRADNRWINLRSATKQENMRNMTISKANTSGVTGVHWAKNMHKWLAYINTGAGRIDIGYFLDRDDAAKARKKFEIEYDFHENHGSPIGALHDWLIKQGEK